MSLDFLCIGAQKAGTTWLYDQLKQLDSYAVTPIKELHYFDRDLSYISPNTASTTKFVDRLLDRKWYLRAAKDIGRTIRDRGEIEDFRFLWHWHTMNYSDASFKKLFERWGGRRTKGEISPSYSILRANDIKRIRDINPRVKIVFLLRDPIDRSWSHCRYYKPDVTYSVKSLIEFIDGDDHTFRGDYLSTLELYNSVFDENQIMVAYFDGIVSNPIRLLSEITEFLSDRRLDLSHLKTLTKKSNPAPHKDIPIDVYNHLKVKYREQIRYLASNYGSYADKWLQTHYGESINSGGDVLTFHP